MNNRIIPYFIIFVAAIALLVVISPVGAEHIETHMSSVDAKLTQYIRQDNAYEHDAEISVMRWQAMGEFYEKQGLLTRDNFDYEKAADLSAARWQAMGDWYARHSQMNIEAAVEKGGILYAMDPVDLKLFNSSEISTTNALAAADQ
jgi:hypothetical protein